MIGPIDRGLFAVIALGFFAVMFMVGVYGWMRAAAQADDMAWDDERAYLDSLRELGRSR